jgi:hypothetical protein
MRVGRATLAVATLACVALIGAPVARGQSDGWFETRPFPDRTFTLDDLGVTDYDGDGDLDVFTTNHLSTQLLMANDGTGGFEDRLTEAGLNHTPAFPGWEDHEGAPDIDGHGLYLFRQHGISLRLSDPGESVSGELRFLAPVSVSQSSGAQVAITQDTTQTPPRYVARFSMSGDSILRLKPETATLPIQVSIDSPYPASRVFVGHRAVRALGSQFTVFVNDRHGMAWADYDHDGHLDVFITRGGHSGHIDRYRALAQDELMLGDGTRFRNELAGSGISKGTCRGRGAAAVDYNRDDLLDLFVACFTGTPRLFKQRSARRFKGVSGRLAQVGAKGHSMIWQDLDARGGPELLMARNGRFVVYRRNKRRWKRLQKLNGRHGSNVQKFAVADYDNDGDPDVLAAARSGSTLLRNRRGRLTKRNPRSVGLPTASLTANWVDYDNDGLLDVHLIPGGIYRQAPRNTFTRTNLALPAGSTTRAVASWFDFDGDGSRDAVIGERHADDGRFTSLRLLENERAAGHWLEVELTGPPGNGEAVGAVVSAATPGRKQTQWVGQNDGSHLSQGHYRVYFGLGAATSAKLKVRWPDGEVQRLGAVDADRIVRISEPG